MGVCASMAPDDLLPLVEIVESATHLSSLAPPVPRRR
jgi:hypothetical protein